MPVDPLTRARLATEQESLLAALTAGAELPADFDAVQLRAAAAALRHKRARTVARLWPALSQSLGSQFMPLFLSFAQTTAIPSEANALVDGRAFAHWLADHGELSEEGQLETLAFDLHYTIGRAGLLRRRWPNCRVVWLRLSRRLVVGVSLPWFGVRWRQISWGGQGLS